MKMILCMPYAGQKCVCHRRTVRAWDGHSQHIHGRQPFGTSQRSWLTKASKQHDKDMSVGLLDQSNRQPLLQSNGHDTREAAEQQQGQWDWLDTKLYKVGWYGELYS